MIASEKEYMRILQEMQADQVKMRVLMAKPQNSFKDFLKAESTIPYLKVSIQQAKDSLLVYDLANTADRRGKWFPIFSGIRFWPEDPRPQDIHLSDIAHSLARINRFNGHTRFAYSVAQHSVVGSYHVHKHCAKHFLMHDAAEAYLGDIITPIKRLFREFWEEAEGRVMDVVAFRFGFSMLPDEKMEVKRVDNVMLATEIRDLTPSGVYNGDIVELPLDFIINECWTPERAEEAFLDRFNELFGDCRPS